MSGPCIYSKGGNVTFINSNVLQWSQFRGIYGLVNVEVCNDGTEPGEATITIGMRPHGAFGMFLSYISPYPSIRTGILPPNTCTTVRIPIALPPVRLVHTELGPTAEPQVCPVACAPITCNIQGLTSFECEAQCFEDVLYKITGAEAGALGCKPNWVSGNGAEDIAGEVFIGMYANFCPSEQGSIFYCNFVPPIVVSDPAGIPVSASLPANASGITAPQGYTIPMHFSAPRIYTLHGYTYRFQYWMIDGKTYNEPDLTITYTCQDIENPVVIGVARYELVTSTTISPISPTISSTTLTYLPTTSPTVPPTSPTLPSPITSPMLSVAPTPTPVTPAPPSKADIYIAIGAVAIIALAGLGYYLYSRRKQ
jgi:hypothetical protein